MITNKITLGVFPILAIICSYMQVICKISEPGNGDRHSRVRDYSRHFELIKELMRLRVVA